MSDYIKYMYREYLEGCTPILPCSVRFSLR